MHSIVFRLGEKKKKNKPLNLNRNLIISNFLMLLKVSVMYSRAFWKPVCSNFKINMMVTINKEGSAGEGSTDGALITNPA